MPGPVGLNPRDINQLFQLACRGNIPELEERIRRVIDQVGGDVFVQAATGMLTQLAGRDPLALQVLTNAVRRLINPPPPFPPNIRMDDVNGARMFQGGLPVERGFNWNNLAGANFNIGQRNPLLMVANTLARQNAWGADAQVQGQALARGMWSDNFFSATELASVSHYADALRSQGHPQTEHFLNGFMNQFVNEVRNRFRQPQDQRQIMTQFMRLAANTNWANPNTPNGFGNFIRRVGDTLANGLNPYQGIRDRVLQNGRPAVLQTYDLNNERGTYGGAFMYMYRDPTGQARTGIFRHIPCPQNNLWNFNFPQIPGQCPQPQPGFQFPPLPPAPGWGNLPPWPGVAQLPPRMAPPAQPMPGLPPGMAPPVQPMPALPPGMAPPGGAGAIWPIPGEQGGVPGWECAPGPVMPRADEEAGVGGPGAPARPPAEGHREIPQQVEGAIPPGPASRPEGIHNQLVLQQTQLRLIQQQLQQYLQERGNEIPGENRQRILNNFRQLQNRFNEIVRTGGNDIQRLRQFSGDLNRFNNEQVVVLDNPPPRVSETIGNFANNLNRVAGETAIDTQTQRGTVNRIRQDFDRALQGAGPLSEEDKDAGVTISNALRVYSDSSRAVRPEEAERLRALANRMRQYSTRLLNAYGENPNSRSIQELANRLDTVSGNLVGVAVPAPPGPGAPFSLEAGRINPNTLRYFYENGFDLAAPEINANNVNTARDELVRLMRSYPPNAPGGMANGLNGDKQAMLFTFMIRYMQSIQNYYQNTYQDNAEVRIQDALPGVSDWGTAIDRFAMYRNDLIGA